MKVYKERTITIKTEEVVSLVCDVCGREARNGSWNDYGYETKEVTVKYESGESFPECGSSQTVEFDLCPDCFTSKLVPFLQSQGAHTEVVEKHW